MHAGTLVAAVLAPHHSENAKFGQGRFAAQQAQNLVVFGRAELDVGRSLLGVIRFSFMLSKLPPRRAIPIRGWSGHPCTPINGSARPLSMRHFSPSNVALMIQRCPQYFASDPFGFSRYRKTTLSSASNSSSTFVSAT